MINESAIEKSRYKNELSFSNKLGRLVWRLTYYIFFRPFIGNVFKGWRNFVLRLFGAKITGDTKIFASVKIWAPWNLEVDSACISYNTILYNVDKIYIGKSTVISHNVHICTASHDIHHKSHRLITKPIVIKDKVWVAVDSFIGPGVTVGQGAVVGARAVVFKDVQNWSVVGGNPAKFIKKRVLSDA